MTQICVVGSGVMGRGIAYSLARGLVRVTLSDNDEVALRSAEREIGVLIDQGKARGKVTAQQEHSLRTNLTYATDPSAAYAQADAVIEAVTERSETKRAIFEAADALTPERCILASNTSTMSPTEIGSWTNRPDRVIAMHFFNPVQKMPLVEIIRGLLTSQNTIARVTALAGMMGKETVLVREFPGFVTSRMSALVGNEAFLMLQEGLASATDIDKAIRLGLNYPMGPLELADLVGLDTRLNNLRYLHQTLGEKFRPAPLLEQYVAAGRLGRKSGHGVFDYPPTEGPQ